MIAVLRMVRPAWRRLGWALVLWPQLGDAFRVPADVQTSFWDALHVSLTTLTTLGFADCNDPGLFVSEAQGQVEVAVPLDDNVCPGLYAPLIAYVLERAGLPAA